MSAAGGTAGVTESGRLTRQDNAGFTTATGCFGPQRVSITLTHVSTPSNTIEAAASLKKSVAVASCVDSHQPPAPMNNSRAVCASTGPITLAAPCALQDVVVAELRIEPVHRRRDSVHHGRELRRVGCAPGRGPLRVLPTPLVSCTGRCTFFW